MGLDTLGSWHLISPLAAGAMGEIWIAEHIHRGTRAALKRLASTGYTDALALRTEIRAVAALDHPHIVQILDYGEQDGPWLAMELAQGSLSRRLQDFQTVRAVLLALLDALAHAHARGVFHRDLKVENILVGGARPGPRLTDFGLAYSLRPDGSAPIVGGTAATMAPEQFYDAPELQGPWTDLYGLACVAWQLTGAGRVFGKAAYEVMAERHRTAPLPAYQPSMAVPVGFEAWLHRSLAKHPEDRFRHAADAARALRELEDPSTEPTPRQQSDPSGPTRRVRLERPALPPALGGIPRHTPLPPFPQVWSDAHPWEDPPRWHQVVHHPDDPTESTSRSTLRMRRAAASLGLLGLRPTPTAGRQQERDQLWEALRRGREGPSMVLIRGPAGTGKTHLAHWLMHRADELGVARPLVAFHGPTPGRHAGLAGLLRRFLRFPSDDEQREQRLAAIGLPGLADDHPVTAAGLLISQLSRERPVLLLLDDLQWGPQAQSLAEALLYSPLPVTVVATVREEALSDLPGAEDAVERLVELGARECELGPLGRADIASLLRSFLPLEPSLLQRLLDRGAGNPLFTVQLLQELATSGRLEPDAGVFRLRGTFRELPADLTEVWRHRIDRLVADRPAWREAIEIAACLGQEVDRREWRAACPSADEGLLVAMVVQRLAIATENGFAFVHGMLREAILEQAGQRAREHHRACVDAVLPGPLLGPRQARHRFAAGDWEEALEPLLLGAWQARLTGDYGLALELLELRQQALTNTERLDATFGNLWARMMFLMELGDRPAAEHQAERAEAWLRAHPEPGDQVMLTMWKARMLRERGDYQASDALLVPLGPRAEALELAAVRWHVQHYRIWNALHTNQPARARLLLDWQEEHRDGRVLDLDTTIGVAAWHLVRDEPATAETVATQAVGIATEIAHTLGLGMAQTFRGIALTRMARLDDAIEAFERSIEAHRQTGLLLVLVARFHLALAQLLNGQVTAARQTYAHTHRDARAESLELRHRFDMALIGTLLLEDDDLDAAIEAVTEGARPGFYDAQTRFVLGRAPPAVRSRLEPFLQSKG